MLQLNNIDKSVLSAPVLEILEAMELKHAKLGYCLTVSAVQSTSREQYWQLRFHDARFTSDDSVEPVGIVEWTYGKRSDNEYKITSRKIQNDRFGHWGNEHSSQRTKDVKKAVKIAMTNLLPFEWHEISNKGRRNAEQAHDRWAREDNHTTKPFVMNVVEVYEEVKYLKSIGVQFKTEAFKNAAAGLEAYEEYVRKASVKARFHTVIDRGEKIIYIQDGHALQPEEFSALDPLPESTRNSIALLKLVDKDKLLPEVGYRAGENTYFVLV